ncbi:TonB-dependent siderophore receptor [Chitinibacteraceae bacterium HSL-7]
MSPWRRLGEQHRCDRVSQTRHRDKASVGPDGRHGGHPARANKGQCRQTRERRAADNQIGFEREKRLQIGLQPAASVAYAGRWCWFDDPAAVVVQVGNGQILKPTRAKQVEGGVKFQPSSAVLLTAAVYELKQDNLSRNVIGADYYEAVGTVDSTGIELEAQVQLTKLLGFQAAYTWNDMEVRNGAADAEGKRPISSPEQMASLWLNVTPNADTRIGAGVRYQGTAWADAANTLRLPSATLFDLSVSVGLGQWVDGLKGAAVQVSANNVFDKDYVGGCWSAGYCYYGSGRSVTTSLKYAW